QELVIVPHDPGAISEVILGYCRDVDALYRLAARGQRAFREAFGEGRQLGPRLRLLTDCLAGRDGPGRRYGAGLRSLAARLLRRPTRRVALTPSEVRGAYRQAPDAAFLLARDIAYDLLDVRE